MDRSLEDYIAGNAILQAAIGSRYTAKFNGRVHSSDEFQAESRHYVCTEMDMDNDMVDEKEESAGTKDTNTKKTFEEAYLALDLNEEEDFDKWFNEHATNNLSKKLDVAIKETVDSSCNDNEKNKMNVFCSADTIPDSIASKTDKLFRQPGFDLRQMVGKKNSNEQGFVSQNGNNKNFNRRKQTRWGNRNNGHMRNNVPYENKRNGNEQFRRSVQLFHNFNPINGNSLHGNGVNTGCCSFQTPVTVNNCQSCVCQKRPIMGNELTLNNAAGYVGSGCNAFGCNGAGVFNSAECCNFNNMSNAIGSGANIFEVCLSNAICNGGRSNANLFQHENVLNGNVNANGGGCQTINKESSSANGENYKGTNVSGSGNDKNEGKSKRRHLATKLGVTANDLDQPPMPVLLALLQEMVKNGISIKLFPKRQNEPN